MTIDPYDNPYCDTDLMECSDLAGGLGQAFYEKPEYKRVMSEAAIDAVEDVIVTWLQRPGTVCCKLDVEHHTVEVYLSTPDEYDHLASYSVPLVDLVLSAATTSEEYKGVPPSGLSGLLRQLADKIDALSKED